MKNADGGGDGLDYESPGDGDDDDGCHGAEDVYYVGVMVVAVVGWIVEDWWEVCGFRHRLDPKSDR